MTDAVSRGGRGPVICTMPSPFLLNVNGLLAQYWFLAVYIFASKSQSLFHMHNVLCNTYMLCALSLHYLSCYVHNHQCLPTINRCTLPSPSYSVCGLESWNSTIVVVAPSHVVCIYTCSIKHWHTYFTVHLLT